MQKTADQPRCEILLDDVKLFSEVFKHDSSRTRAISLLTASCSHRSLSSCWRLLAAANSRTVHYCRPLLWSVDKINHIEQTTEHGLVIFTSWGLMSISRVQLSLDWVAVLSFFCGEKAATTQDTEHQFSQSHYFTLICDTLKWFPHFLYQPVGQLSFPSP